MSLSPETLQSLPQVPGVLYYLRPMAAKPHRYNYEPPPGVPESNAVYDPHTCAIRDVRTVADQLSLDAEGVKLLPHRSRVRDFYDEAELREVYYPEAEALVAEATGASRVLVFDHTIRRRAWDSSDRVAGTPRLPVLRVHNDYTEISAPQRVRDLLGEEAGELLQRRYAIINVWRPIRGPLRDVPLAACDAGSVAYEDFIASDLIYRDRTGEIYVVRHNPAHRWYYASQMQTDEVWLLKCFDSARDGRGRFAPHTGFVDPTAPADVLPRESIELRTLVFYPK